MRCLCDCHKNRFDNETLNLIQSIVDCSNNNDNNNNCNIECNLCHCTLNIGKIYQQQKENAKMAKQWEKIQKEMFAENINDPDYCLETDLHETISISKENEQEQDEDVLYC